MFSVRAFVLGVLVLVSGATANPPIDPPGDAAEEVKCVITADVSAGGGSAEFQRGDVGVMIEADKSDGKVTVSIDGKIGEVASWSVAASRDGLCFEMGVEEAVQAGLITLHSVPSRDPGSYALELKAVAEARLGVVVCVRPALTYVWAPANRLEQRLVSRPGWKREGKWTTTVSARLATGAKGELQLDGRYVMQAYCMDQEKHPPSPGMSRYSAMEAAPDELAEILKDPRLQDFDLLQMQVWNAMREAAQKVAPGAANDASNEAAEPDE